MAMPLASFPPSASVARQRGLRRRLQGGPCPTPEFLPIPAMPGPAAVLACLTRAYVSPSGRAYDLRSFASCYSTLRYLQRLARADRGRGGAIIPTSMRQLVRGLAPIEGWARSEDAFADRDTHHSSVRRWLGRLQDAGLISWEEGLNEALEHVRTEIRLRPLPPVTDDELRAARARLRLWRARYGPRWETGARRCLAALVRRSTPPTPSQRRREGQRRGAAIARARRAPSPSHQFSAPPVGALPIGREPSLVAVEEGAHVHEDAGARARVRAAIQAGLTVDDPHNGLSSIQGSGSRAELQVSEERKSALESVSGTSEQRAGLDELARRLALIAVENLLRAPAGARPPAAPLMRAFIALHPDRHPGRLDYARLVRVVERWERYSEYRPAGSPEGGVAAVMQAIAAGPQSEPRPPHSPHGLRSRPGLRGIDAVVMPLLADLAPFRLSDVVRRLDAETHAMRRKARAENSSLRRALVKRALRRAEAGRDPVRRFVRLMEAREMLGVDLSPGRIAEASRLARRDVELIAEATGRTPAEIMTMLTARAERERTQWEARRGCS